MPNMPKKAKEEIAFTCGWNDHPFVPLDKNPYKDFGLRSAWSRGWHARKAKIRAEHLLLDKPPLTP